MNKELLIELRPEILAHQEADRFIQGAWLKDKDKNGVYRGCFFGCTMQTDLNPIKGFCEIYDVPLWIGYWSEKVFEGLSASEAVFWPLQLIDALIQFDGDLEIVKHKLALKRLSYLSERNEGEVKKSIDGVILCHKKAIAGNPKIDWNEAGSAVQDAIIAQVDVSAASLALYSAAASSEQYPHAVAKSSSWSADLADPVNLALRSASWSASWQRERDWLLELLKDTP